MTIGQNIRALRKRRGLSQGQLGQLCGINGGTVSSYERGMTLPKRQAAEKIARALEVPLERLTGEACTDMPAEEKSAAAGVPLYDGVLLALGELYGPVEGRTLLGENGRFQRYYVVHQPSGRFILREGDIAALARMARASLALLGRHIERRDRDSGAEKKAP